MSIVGPRPGHRMPHSFTFVEIIYGFSLRAHRFAETTGDNTTEAHFRMKIRGGRCAKSALNK